MQIKIKIPNLSATQKVYLAVVAASAGSSVSTFFATKTFYKAKYEEIANKEIAEAQQYQLRLHKQGVFADPETAAVALEQERVRTRSKKDLDFKRPEKVAYEKVVQKSGYNPTPFGHEPAVIEAPVETEEELDKKIDEAAEVFEEAAKEVVNIFDQPKPSTPDWDWDFEMSRRSMEKPYILHKDEFFADDKDHEHDTLTYFQGDDVLTNERDEIVDNVDALVGNSNLMHFGHGSGDKNVVYIRNERTETDFEILLSKGYHAVEVLGADPAILQHADHRPGVLRFRSERE